MTGEPGFQFKTDNKSKVVVDHVKDSEEEIKANIKDVVQDEKVHFDIDKHAKHNLGENA